MAALNKQGTVEIRRRRNVQFWAWAISLSIHVILLTALGIVNFSPSNSPQTVTSVPSARIVQAAASMQNSIMPKPKITEPLAKQLVKSPQLKPPATNAFIGAVSHNHEITESGHPSEETNNLPARSVMPGKVEFFGSYTDKRKVCYVVDCSGSMRGLMARVQRELKDSIAALEPDQFFSIIFFGDGRLLEFCQGQLVRATESTKALAAEFIDSARPAGATNALTALERAVRVRDSGGESPSAIYFLSDGFEVSADDRYLFCLRVKELLERYAPAASIHTIGLWPQDSDRQMLELIAQQTGGNFVVVSDRHN